MCLKRVQNEGVMIATAMEGLRSTAKDRQDEAYRTLMLATDQPVAWAYDIWPEIVTLLGDNDNRRRAIAAQILANLAKSDPEQRMTDAFPALLQVTRDDRFVTARHCLQSLWNVAVVSPENQRMVVDGLALRFAECAAEKNCTLIRYDIAVALRQIYDVSKDTGVHETAKALIATETATKYRKKYEGAWKIK